MLYIVVIIRDFTLRIHWDVTLVFTSHDVLAEYLTIMVPQSGRKSTSSEAMVTSIT